MSKRSEDPAIALAKLRESMEHGEKYSAQISVISGLIASVFSVYFVISMRIQNYAPAHTTF